jgi:hypothetical protein
VKRFFALIWLFLVVSQNSLSAEVEYLNQVVIPNQLLFQKTKIGGLSGLYFDPDSQNLYAISDDRGLVNEPRIYEFKLQVSLKDFKVEPQKVIFLKVNESSLAHHSTNSPANLFSRVLDLEAISITPWGDFLITNEGDLNKKPRVLPQLISAKKDGTLEREFQVPEAYLPELGGVQKKGVQNNLAFEGLARNPNGKEWLMSAEAPLVQDPKNFVRLLQYTMPEAWVLKPGTEYKYPFTEGKMEPDSVIEFQKGISEIQFKTENLLWVVERLLKITKKGISLQVELYETDLKKVDAQGLLSKRLILDFSTLEKQIGPIENYEGMTWGPMLPDGRRSLIIVSDDNFMKRQRTQFLLLAVRDLGK